MCEEFHQPNASKSARIEPEIDWGYIRPKFNAHNAHLENNCRYSRINYRLYLLSETCITNPIDTNSAGMNYIPGYEVLRAVREKLTDSGYIRCSCAYPEIDRLGALFMIMNERTREILKVGVPAMFEGFSTTFANIIDSKMVSSMGLAAISAISVTNQPRYFFVLILCCKYSCECSNCSSFRS